MFHSYYLVIAPIVFFKNDDFLAQLFPKITMVSPFFIEKLPFLNASMPP